MDVSYTEVTYGDYPQPVDKNGKLIAKPLLWAEEHLQRGQFYLLNATKAADPRIRAWLLAAGVISCQSALETLEAWAKEDELLHEVGPILSAIPRKTLINLIRNLDVHKMPLPWKEGEYVLGGLTIEASNGGGAGIQILPDKPRRHKHVPPESRPEGTANVKDGKAGYLWVRNGEHLAFDPAAGKQISLLDAVGEFIGGFGEAFPRLMAAWGNER